VLPLVIMHLLVARALVDVTYIKETAINADQGE
jgi:hypothetical protein